MSRTAAETVTGPSAEMRRFSAGMRAIVAMLCTALLLTDAAGIDRHAPVIVAALLVYDLWASLLLWSEARGRPVPWSMGHYWIDITWTGLLLQASSDTTSLLILTAVQPVVLVSIGYGVMPGVVLAFYAAAWVLFRYDPQQIVTVALSNSHLVTAAAVLALVPAAALLARPMSVLRQRLGLMRDLESRLDPRRGLHSVAVTLTEGLRTDLQSDLAAVVLPAAARAPAILSTFDDGSFEANVAVHARLEATLAQLPPCAVAHRRRRFWPLSGSTQLFGTGAATRTATVSRVMDELCALLEVRELLVVPFTRYEQRHGHLLVGGHNGVTGYQAVDALIDAGPEIFRILEQAALVDRLASETSAHERVRIGRDLHDSAIQPYLGLKYALEALVRRVSPDNPARPDIEALTQLVEGEIATLREVVSNLRNGQATGDNTLLPAVRRQLGHFSDLFGIEVQFEAPDQLRTSRALAGAVFHMVNEALNNVRKHSAARHVLVSMQVKDGWLQLRVRDDGATVKGRAAPGFHPRSLADRAQELGGKLSVTQPDGFNTEVLITVPLDAVVRT